jgi:hypothetical protein
MADLSGVLAKLDRAEEHRLEFDELVEEYVGGEPYTIYSEYDPATGWHTLRWQALREPPLERLGLVFGDMISNLRTTLDYLVWQLVLAAGQRPGRCTESSSSGWTRSTRASRTIGRNDRRSIPSRSSIT